MSAGPARHGHDLVAGNGQRALARLIDFAIVMTVVVAFAPSRVVTDDGAIRLPRWVILVTIAVFVVYETVGVAWRGQTVGKAATRIKVVDAASGRRPAAIQASLRVLVVAAAWVALGSFGLLAMILVYLTGALDRSTGRGLPDRVAGTAVVQIRAHGDMGPI
ncbi:MAG: RDD family protein [Acidimicrobiia bacterium]|nr:RDD family protein [Acidimicrobiia bacterium]